MWSRGEELITDKFPELSSQDGLNPDGTVLDGELLPYKDNKVGYFNDLQKRIGRKTVSKKLQDEIPIIIMLYDILEWEGNDIRNYRLIRRKEILESLYKKIIVYNAPVLLSLSLIHI